MMITSLENDKVKNWVKLQQKKYRDISNRFIVEGEHLVQEAIKSNQVVEIITTDETNDPNKAIIVSTEVMKKISVLDTPPTVIAVCEKKKDGKILGEKILLLDEIQDPGNLGTIIRSALAFNVDTVVLSNNCVDLYNQKVIRATQGMFFHCNVVEKDITEVISYMKENSIPIYGTSVEKGEDSRKLSQNEKKSFCLIMGNEGNGVSKEILKICDKRLFISMNEKVESLNVGVACSILLYELNR